MLVPVLAGLGALALMSNPRKRRRKARKNPDLKVGKVYWDYDMRRVRLVKMNDDGWHDLVDADTGEPTTTMNAARLREHHPRTGELASEVKSNPRRRRKNPLCPICHRKEVDAMTLESTGVDKKLCYRDATGGDPRCKPKYKTRRGKVRTGRRF